MKTVRRRILVVVLAIFVLLVGLLLFIGWLIHDRTAEADPGAVREVSKMGRPVLTTESAWQFADVITVTRYVVLDMEAVDAPEALRKGTGFLTTQGWQTSGTKPWLVVAGIQPSSGE